MCGDFAFCNVFISPRIVFYWLSYYSYRLYCDFWLSPWYYGVYSVCLVFIGLLRSYWFYRIARLVQVVVYACCSVSRDGPGHWWVTRRVTSWVTGPWRTGWSVTRRTTRRMTTDETNEETGDEDERRGRGQKSIKERAAAVRGSVPVTRLGW